MPHLQNEGHLWSCAEDEYMPCRCVSKLQEAGLKVLADIVINHRCAQAQVASYPAESQPAFGVLVWIVCADLHVTKLAGGSISKQTLLTDEAVGNRENVASDILPSNPHKPSWRRCSAGGSSLCKMHAGTSQACLKAACWACHANCS